MIIKKKQVSQITLPWQLTGCCRTSILSRTLFAMVSTSKSLLTARWVMRSVGEKFTFCLQKIGGSSSSFMCMNPVVLCKTHIFEKKTHKIYIETLKATSTIRRGICERNYVKFAHNFNWKKTSNITRDRQRTRNVTRRHVRATTVAAEKQWVLHNLSVSICRLGYPECNAHPPYCHFFHIISQTVRFLKKSYRTQNACFDFLHDFIPRRFFHSKRKWARYEQKCISVFK